MAAVSAREIELGTFTPSSNSDLDLIDYGTVRVTKVKKNHYTISGDFFLKQNLANDKTVKAFAISFFLMLKKFLQIFHSLCLRFTCQTAHCC